MFAIPDEQFPTSVTEVMIIVPEPDPQDPDITCPSCDSFKRALDRNGITYVATTKRLAPAHVQEQIDKLNIQTAPTIVADGKVVAAGGVQIPVVRRILKAYTPAAVSVSA